MFVHFWISVDDIATWWPSAKNVVKQACSLLIFRLISNDGNFKFFSMLVTDLIWFDLIYYV
jgi:hypothetical protein